MTKQHIPLDINRFFNDHSPQSEGGYRRPSTGRRSAHSCDQARRDSLREIYARQAFGALYVATLNICAVAARRDIRARG